MRFGGGEVEQALDVVDCGGEDGGTVDGGEEFGRAWMEEIVDLEAEFRLGEGSGGGCGAV